MTPTDHVDPGFAPWSLMTPDPAKAKPLGTGAAARQPGAHSIVHEDKRAPEIIARDGYMFGDDGLTFGDFLDMVNPLQHLPVVGAVYRGLTDDEITPGAKLAGGILYGGPLGLASAAVNNAIEEHTGKDMAGHALAWIGLGEDGAENVAQAEETLDAPLQTAALQTPAGPPGTASADPGVVDLGARQAAALERFAARVAQTDGAAQTAAPAAPGTGRPASSGAIGSIGSIDTVLTQAGAAPAAADKPRDFGGIARISNEMTRHLALLAQAQSAPAVEAAPEVQPAAAVTAAARPPVDGPSPYMTGPLPQALDGHAPIANPFVGMAAKPEPVAAQPPRPDPFDVALERLGLRKPQLSAPQQAAFDGVTPPGTGERDGVVAAMESALRRYEAMKREG